MYEFADFAGTFYTATKRVWLPLSTWKNMAPPFLLSTPSFPPKTTRYGPASRQASTPKTTASLGTLCTIWRDKRYSMRPTCPAPKMLNGGRMLHPFGAQRPSTAKRLLFTIGMTANYPGRPWRTRKIADHTLLLWPILSLQRAKLLGSLTKLSLNFTKTDIMPQW